MIKLTASTIVSIPLDRAMPAWVSPEHMNAWNASPDDWHCPLAANGFRLGGGFCYKKSAFDGSLPSNFEGTCIDITCHVKIGSKVLDGLAVAVTFIGTAESGRVGKQ